MDTETTLTLSRRITTINKWFEENGYDVKEIWDAIEVIDYQHCQ